MKSNTQNKISTVKSSSAAKTQLNDTFQEKLFSKDKTHVFSLYFFQNLYLLEHSFWLKWSNSSTKLGENRAVYPIIVKTIRIAGFCRGNSDTVFDKTSRLYHFYCTENGHILTHITNLSCETLSAQ
jgi:hypothetical protein